MYKMILSDLDETLLIGQHVPEFNQKAIAKARQKGTKFVVATGRAYYMIPEILKEIGTYNIEDEYSICCNGGLIVENKDDKVLHFKGLSYQKAKQVFDLVKDKEVCILLFTLDKCYIYNPDPYEVSRKIEQKTPLQVMEDHEFEFLKEERIAKILVERRDMNYLKNLKEELMKDIDEVSFSFSSNRYLEVNAEGIDKGYGLRWLANYLNVDIKDTIAIGDNYNDVEMIQEAGLGVCVQCATDDIKALADYTTDADFDEGAVKEVIERFVL